MTKVRGVGGGREDRGQQGAGARELHVDQRDHALVDIQLGHALWSVREVAEDRRDPLLEEDAVGVVAGVVDRAFGLGAGARKVDQQLRLGLGDLRQRHPLGVEAGRIDAVMLGVIFPDVGAVWDLAEQLAAERLGGALEDGQKHASTCSRP